MAIGVATTRALAAVSSLREEGDVRCRFLCAHTVTTVDREAGLVA